MSARFDQRSEHSDLIAELLAGYRPLPGVYDEMMADDGTVARALARAPRRARRARTRRAGAPVRGERTVICASPVVFYRVYEDKESANRAWPLAHVPLMIEAGEWEALQAGLIERASLVEAVHRTISTGRPR